MMQDIHGVLLIDKPADMTSAKLVSRIKSLLKVKKAGHAGTLDPFATGLMICCLNRATRLARFFLNGGKTYDALLGLGVETDTQDFTGNPVAVNTVPFLSRERIAATLEMFEGSGRQTPPVFSALKHQGVPLYKYARKGKAVQKPPRPITIFKMRLREVRLPDVRFEVSCSAGTYVRTLCADIGRRLGCGGHLKALRRLKSSGFLLEKALTLEGLEKAVEDGTVRRHVIAPAAALASLPEWRVGPRLKDKILNGVPLARQDLPPEIAKPFDDLVKVVDDQGELLAVAQGKKDGQTYDYCCVFN